MATLDPAKIGIKPPFGKKDFRVFIFGPGIDPANPVLPQPVVVGLATISIFEKARYIRSRLFVELGKEYTADLGETKEIFEFWTRLLQIDDLGIFELLHGGYAAGCNIILPSSAGSFCELGLFCRYDLAAFNTFTLIDESFRSSPSFLSAGILPMLKAKGGQVDYNSYDDAIGCIAKVRAFVQSKYHNLLDNHLKIDEGKRIDSRLKGTLNARPRKSKGS